MKMKKFWMIVCMIAAFLFLFAGCGNQASADDEEDPTTMETAEKVTEFDKDQTSLTFADIENGINFKAAGTSVTFRFEDIDSFGIMSIQIKSADIQVINQNNILCKNKKLSNNLIIN